MIYKSKAGRNKERLLVSIQEVKKYECQYENCDEEHAKKALKNFFKAYLSIPEEKRLTFGVENNYYSYLYCLLLFRSALLNKKYGKACHELCELCELEPIFQHRIRFSLAKLYKMYLE